jgi:hypothetical protein
MVKATTTPRPVAVLLSPALIRNSPMIAYTSLSKGAVLARFLFAELVCEMEIAGRFLNLAANRQLSTVNGQPHS